MPSVVHVRSDCETFAHIARQQCRCHGTFEPEREEYRADPASGRVRRQIHCRCLTAGCRAAAVFEFEFDPARHGLGWSAAVEATDPLHPAAAWPQLGVAAQVTVHLLAAVTAYRATAAAAAPAAIAAAIQDMAGDVRRHLGLPDAADAEVAAGVDLACAAFDRVARALAGPPAETRRAAAAPAG